MYHKILYLIYRIRFNKYYKNNVYLHPFSFVTAYVNIGYGTRINGPTHISGQKNSPVNIGKYCAIAYNLRIRARNHSVSYPCIQNTLLQQIGLTAKYDYKENNVSIGHACWIGDNVTILAGVQIGNGAVIGGGAVVTNDILPYAIAVGNPAKIIKYRFTDTIIKQLEIIQWWNWSIEKMKRNKKFFDTNLKEIDSILEIINE